MLGIVCNVVEFNCAVNFLFNNQPDALIIHIYSVKTLHVSGNFFAHHQEFSAVHSALVSYDDRLQAVRMERTSILTLLGSGHHKPHETYQCRMYSRGILMMGKKVARNM